jgi:membrane associated rhomboid family serine protease
MGIWDDIKRSFRAGSSLTRLIYINLAVFLAVNLIYLIFFFSGAQEQRLAFIRWLAVPADISTLITRPWTLVTYMFLHEGIFHILFNLLVLFWFGRIFLEYLDHRKLLGVYILGGLTGAITYILAYNIFPVFSQEVSRSVALGASASVMAIVFAISVYVPNHSINLLFIGPTKLKYIALVAIVLDLIQIPGGNAGGHIAHLGGALFGSLFIYRFRQGKDLTRGINRIIVLFENLFKPKPKIKVTHKKKESDMEFRKRKSEEQMSVDKILDKISKGGYESLSSEEKEILFRASNKQ